MCNQKSILSLVCALALLGGLVMTTPVLAAAEETQWVEKAPMTDVRTYFGAEVINGKIYVFGGRTSDDVSSDVEIYDPGTDFWTKGTSMPTAKYNFASAVINGKIYIIGGFDNSDAICNTVEIYNPETNSWENGTSMPTARVYHRAVSLNGKIYVIGGSNNVDSTNVMEIYDPASNTWTTGTQFPSAGITNFAVAALQDKIYLFGGSIRENTGAGSFGSDKTYRYDLETDTWEQGPDLPESVFIFPGNVLGDKIYLLGGSLSTTAVTNKVHIFDPVTNTFSNGPNMTIERFGHSSVVIDHTIYAIGGISDRTSNKMEALEVSMAPTPASPKLSVYLNPTEAVQLSVSDTLSDNTTVTWTSSSTAVATVDTNGKVTAVAPGLSEITATNADGNSQSIPVRVLPGTADLFRLAVHLTPGQTQQLGMSVAQEGVTWKSLSESVVTVDSNGNITAVATGLAIVQATAGSEVQQIYVRVK